MMKNFKKKYTIAKIRFNQYKVKHRKKVRIVVFALLTALMFIASAVPNVGFIYLAIVIIWVGQIKNS